MDIHSRNWGAAAHDTAEGIHRPFGLKVLTVQAERDQSPDFVYAMSGVVEREMQAPCLFLQWASGELAPREQYVGDRTEFLDGSLRCRRLISRIGPSGEFLQKLNNCVRNQ